MEFSMKDNFVLSELLQIIFLALSARLGFYINACSDLSIKKWMCTLLGLINVAVMLQEHMWHYFLSVLVTIAIILLTGPKYCHITGFLSSFSYLIGHRLMLYCQNIEAEQVLIAIQSLAVTMVCGIGFEIHMAYKRQVDGNDKKMDPSEDDLFKIGFLDIFHYVFNYATVCTGPYVRYQVYSDFIKLPYSRAIRRSRISNTLINITSSFSILLFAILTEYVPVQYMLSEEFTKRSIMYQLNYTVIQLVRFRMYLYSAFGLIRYFSTISGIGAYPVENKPIVSYGPTVNTNNFRSKTFEEAKEMDLDLNTTEAVTHKYETAPTITEATRNWNKGVQYWLGFYIHKSLPKKLGRIGRLFVTLVVSWLWHSVYPSILITCVICGYYYIVEGIYINLQKHLTGKIVTFMNIIFWISRQYFWAWSLVTYLILDTRASLAYFKSTYYLPLVFTILMHILYIFIFSKIIYIKQKKSKL